MVFLIQGRKKCRFMKTWGCLGSLQSFNSVKAVRPWGLLLQISGPPESPCTGEVNRNTWLWKDCSSWIKEIICDILHRCIIVVFCSITWQIPPFFLSNLVHIMWAVLKVSCQICLHSLGNWIFSLASLSTCETGPLDSSFAPASNETFNISGGFPFFLR